MYPNKEQKVLLNKTLGAARFAYNWALEKKEAYYKAGVLLSAEQLDALWTQLRPLWALETCRASQTVAILNLGQAYRNFFQGRAGKPVFHKKRKTTTFYLKNSNARILGNKIQLNKIGWVKITEALRLSGKIQSYIVSTYADEWYVSVIVELPETDRDIPGSVCGIDVGLENHPAHASDGTQLILPLEKLHKLQAKLKRAQKALSRSRRNSRNRDKRLIKKQKVQQKINNIRQDVTHKFTTKVCKSHATVVIEDLNIEEMIKKAPCKDIRRALNSSLMFSIHRQLSYKAGKIIKAPRFFPSSKTCSNCGAIKSELPPTVRVYKCERCGAVLDRDYNAALNLMKLGLVKPE